MDEVETSARMADILNFTSRGMVEDCCFIRNQLIAYEDPENLEKVGRALVFLVLGPVGRGDPRRTNLLTSVLEYADFKFRGVWRESGLCDFGHEIRFFRELEENHTREDLHIMTRNLPEEACKDHLTMATDFVLQEGPLIMFRLDFLCKLQAYDAALNLCSWVIMALITPQNIEVDWTTTVEQRKFMLSSLLERQMELMYKTYGSFQDFWSKISHCADAVRVVRQMINDSVPTYPVVSEDGDTSSQSKLAKDPGLLIWATAGLPNAKSHYLDNSVELRAKNFSLTTVIKAWVILWSAEAEKLNQLESNNLEAEAKSCRASIACLMEEMATLVFDKSADLLNRELMLTAFSLQPSEKRLRLLEKYKDTWSVDRRILSDVDFSADVALARKKLDELSRSSVGKENDTGGLKRKYSDWENSSNKKWPLREHHTDFSSTYIGRKKRAIDVRCVNTALPVFEEADMYQIACMRPVMCDHHRNLDESDVVGSTNFLQSNHCFTTLTRLGIENIGLKLDIHSLIAELRHSALTWLFGWDHLEPLGRSFLREFPRKVIPDRVLVSYVSNPDEAEMLKIEGETYYRMVKNMPSITDPPEPASPPAPPRIPEVVVQESTEVREQTENSTIRCDVDRAPGTFLSISWNGEGNDVLMSNDVFCNLASSAVEPVAKSDSAKKPRKEPDASHRHVSELLMPQRKGPMALEKMVISRVSLWLSSDNAGRSAVVSQSLKGGPFPYDLTGKILKSSIETFFDSNVTWTSKSSQKLLELIECLLQLDVADLDLSSVFRKRRIAGYFNSQLERALISNLPRLSHLRSINLMGKATTPILQCIAANCKRLVELTCNLSSIDDKGLACFGDFLDGSGCPNLECFRFHECWLVTPPAVGKLLLGLKKLTVLGYDSSFRAVTEFLKLQKASAEAQDVSSDSNSSPTLHLSHLVEKESEYSDGVLPRRAFRNVNFRHVASACPRVTHLNFLYMDEEIFAEFGQFDKLSSITMELRHGGGGPFFQAYISAFGNRLRELNFTCEDFSVKALMELGRHCHNLEKLKIIRKHSSGCASEFPLTCTGFSRLEVLSITNHFTDEPISEEEVTFCLRNAFNVQELYLSGELGFMSDDFWDKFLRSVNPLVQLRSFRFDSFPEAVNLGFSTARLFIDSCPNLNKISVGTWKNISSEDIGDLKLEVAMENYDLVIC
ncbi:unnamed protein product [Notodromas monacha]|uniref:Uncharacterized protein n=1 Tax=Notodromas monacha TaxID=399045 RepID=A0A7R9GG05_9CRUS|nr:unnamed protein product [Notodromas monacha]CAG0919466.1 unnamed protein product [Notodromas monacha]